MNQTIVMKRPAELKPYENNPRNNEAAVTAVAASIREFGFRVPIIVDAQNVIVCGHTRLKAAEALGLEEIPCIVADDLTPEQIRAFRLADNKTAELATWDDAKLAEELMAIGNIDMAEFGFDLGVEDDGDVEEVDIPESAPSMVRPGDLWELGRHRLLCGDATDPTDFQKLTGGVRWTCA